MTDSPVDIVYVDSSVLLRFILDEKDKWLDFRKMNQGLTSELTQVECFRTIDRLRINGSLDDKGVMHCRNWVSLFMKATDVILIDRDILEVASQPMPTSIRTLDAIHLASAILWSKTKRAQLVFATHDEQLGIAAQAHGFEVVGLSRT